MCFFPSSIFVVVSTASAETERESANKSSDRHPYESGPLFKWTGVAALFVYHCTTQKRTRK